MKRIARILGVLGGLGAILWAMRDRLVSVALPREPQVPAFEVPRPATPPAQPAKDEASITSVSGIGPVYATRLAEAGINSIDDLSEADIERVAQAADVPTAKAQAWIEEARTRSVVPNRPSEH